MKYEICSTRKGGITDAEGDTWYEIDTVLDSFEATPKQGFTADEVATDIAANAYEGKFFAHNDPRYKIIGRGEPWFVEAFITEPGNEPPYVLRKVI